MPYQNSRLIDRRSVLAATALIAAAPATAFAQADYPSHAIKFVVPVPPGNMLDAMPRIIGDKLSPRWNQPVIVENRPGAASNLGTEMVFKSPPDGYTLLVSPPGPLAISQHVYTKLGFDPSQFTAVSELVRFPFLLIANNNFPVSSLGELITRAKGNPDKITFATPGVSSTPHLTMEKLSRAASMRFVHVPYQGLSPALNDLLGGHVDIYVSSLPQVLSLAKDGQARALAVTSARRTALLPDVPTLEEAGIAGFDLQSWWGIVGPAGMPTNVVNTLNAEIGKMLTSPELTTILSNEGAEAETMTPQQFGDLMRSETERWIKVAHEANISID
jgi:tripartite-type tricarboxylate transporter receptor subunit TctC